MLVIKIWGSVFAPKKSEIFNTDLLLSLSKILFDTYKGQIILIHGTWNIGHDFVNKYWVNRKSYEIYKKLREPFFKKMENIFTWFNRIKAEDVLKKWNIVSHKSWNFIIWWDIDSVSLDIISSDIVFWILSKENKNTKKIILTDVAWVLDNSNKIIKILELSLIDKINFWDKDWDVTDWMRWKISALSDYLEKNWSGVWIIDGNNLNNIRNIINLWNWEWTYVIK